MFSNDSHIYHGGLGYASEFEPNLTKVVLLIEIVFLLVSLHLPIFITNSHTQSRFYPYQTHAFLVVTLKTANVEYCHT